VQASVEQAVQVPARHTWFVPQVVPSGWFPPSVQTGDPLLQTSVAVWHGFVDVQELPAAQAMQLPPLLQTLSVPQGVPGWALVPLSLHTGPLAQTRVPRWQALVGTQLSPTLHWTQAPALHTWSVPQLLPSAALPLSVQTGVPVAQERVAVRQGLRDWQAAPQARQVPARQMLFVPQVVPSTWSPLSVHTGEPELQAISAVWHGFVDAQELPAAHATQLPSLQTRFVPQLVPLGWLPVSVQTGESSLHCNVAVWQGLDETHVPPDLQSEPQPARSCSVRIWAAIPRLPKRADLLRKSRRMVTSAASAGILPRARRQV
jgi:hypothetical protein